MNYKIVIIIISALAILTGFLFNNIWTQLISYGVLLVIIYVLCQYVNKQEKERGDKNTYILISDEKLSNIFMSKSTDGWTYALSFSTTVFFTCLIPLLTTNTFNGIFGLQAVEIQTMFKLFLGLSLLSIVVIVVHNLQNGYLIKQDSMKMKEEIIKNNMFDSDNTVILIFPKFEKAILR